VAVDLSPDSPTGSLARIRQLHQAGKRGPLLRAAKKHLKKYPVDPTSEEVLWMAGEAEFAGGRLYDAYEFFERQTDTFPAGTLFEKAMIRQAEIGKRFLAGEKRRVWGFLWFDASDEGAMILRKIVEQAPGTVLAEDVAMHLAEWRFSKGQWVEAISAYDAFLKSFPNGRRAPQAILRSAEASMNAYRGPDYDETPLLEARARYQMLTEQFPAVAETHDVGDALDRIDEARAERLMVQGDFYDRTHRTDAAVYYYRRVIEEFPRTYHATLAREALGPLGADLVEDAPPRRRRRMRRRPVLGPTGAGTDATQDANHDQRTDR